MPYIHFTKEQKERANSVDLVDFLRRRGEKLIPSGREKRLERDHSITIRGSQWYDHAAERGGGAISFVQNFYGMSYPDAVTHLLGGESGVIYRAAEKEAEEQKEFSLPPENTAMRRVYAYLLQQRNISRDILTEFVRADLIYESCEKSADGRKEYHNAVFVGKDEHGIARHAHKRGLYTMGGGFKRNVAGSDPRYSFHYIGDGDNLFVFEAPIDMLSFITMYPENWKQRSYVALCGVSKHALLWVLEQNPHIQSVVLCLDNDAPGIKAAKRLEDTLREKNYAKVECRFSAAKDWNEELRRQCSGTSEQNQSTMKMG